MDDLTKELWQGVAERVNRPDPVGMPPLLATEPPPPITDERGWREFLGSRKLGVIYAVACVLGLLAIISAHPFASPSVSERVAERLGQPATCTERGAIVSAGSPQTIYRCAVGNMNTRQARCFAVSDGDVRLVSGRRELGC